MERRLAAILAADVVGYSRLIEADEEATVRTLSTYREIIVGLVASHHGRVFGSAGGIPSAPGRAAGRSGRTPWRGCWWCPGRSPKWRGARSFQMPLPIWFSDWNRIMVRAAAAKIKAGARHPAALYA